MHAWMDADQSPVLLAYLFQGQTFQTMAVKSGFRTAQAVR
jgi:hypothetical protein